jgi:hypothetical protein
VSVTAPPPNIPALGQPSIPAPVPASTPLVSSKITPAPTAEARHIWRAPVFFINRKLRSIFPRQAGRVKLESAPNSAVLGPKLDSRAQKVANLAQKTDDVLRQVDDAEGSVEHPADVDASSTYNLDQKVVLSQASYNRLSSRLVKILDAIKLCATICSTYQKEHFLCPFLISRICHN